MEEYANKFLEMLWYVRYIKDEKVKIQHFLSLTNTELSFMNLEIWKKQSGKISMNKENENLNIIGHGSKK